MNNFYLSCKECVHEGPRSFYGCFYLGPFNNSQSLTVANALRRTLLSEISGLGIITAQIEGVDHEYSTFLGIRESVLDILLNLKEIVLCYNSNSEYFNFTNSNQITKKQKRKTLLRPFIGYLQATGPGVIRASDLKLPSFLKCVDPDQYIATLAENGKLNLKIEICENKFFNGKTNTNLFQQNNLKNSISKNFLNNSKRLKVDCIFTPIKKVNYTIEQYGTLTLNPNNQVIYLELWTNGSIHPRMALYEALSILNSTFSKLEKMKILNDVYIKSILKSDHNYSKLIKKTLYKLNFTRQNLTKNKLIEFNKNLKNTDSFDKLKGIYQNQKENKLITEFTPIQILNLPFRIENCFIQANILTLNDLFKYNFNDLKQVPGLGNQSLQLLQKKLLLFLCNTGFK
jgi:DNA-directed RNA polymerase subunit alpha